MTATPLAGFVAIPIADVHPSPNNPREHLHDIAELAASIAADGLVQPIIVQKLLGGNGYQIIAGHRRLEACARLGWAKVPCIIRRDLLPDEELVAILVENGQRSGLDPIEEARALKRLVDSGRSAADVGKRIGRPGSYVSGRLLLLSLPLAEQEEVRAGHYTLSHAKNLVRDAREAERRRANPVARPVGRPKGATTRPYFGDTHPLAKTARGRCSCKAKPKVGGVACGQCWEAVIREDALTGREAS
jgi:ParB family transcriptional regulator, chromosome partitioning protein